jgi:hypothetical protein
MNDFPIPALKDEHENARDVAPGAPKRLQKHETLWDSTPLEVALNRVPTRPITTLGAFT